MAMVEQEKALSISRIARATGLKRYVVAAIVEHYGIAVVRSPSLTVVLPDGRARLIEAMERHPGVEPGLDRRL